MIVSVKGIPTVEPLVVFVTVAAISAMLALPFANGKEIWAGSAAFADGASTPPTFSTPGLLRLRSGNS